MRARLFAMLISLLLVLTSCHAGQPAVSEVPSPPPPKAGSETTAPTPASDGQPPAIRGGMLQGDETWSGKVLVNESVIVPPGVTLTIAPGTEIRFRHYRGYKEDKVGLLVEGGTVKAIGTPDRQIWFTSDADDPINGDWGGISLVNSTDSRFDYVIVEYAEIGIEQFHSQADVSNSIIRWNNSEGLYAESSRATFTQNTIYGNAYHAIALENFNRQIDITRNLIIGDGHQTIHLERSKALIEGNYFKHFVATGERAISLMAGSHAVVRKNKFDLHSDREAFAIDPDCTLQAEDNDFGDGHISPPKFDYRDVKKSELGYLPGDPQDRYLYVFDARDETREVVARYGKGLGLGWSLAYADGGVWRFAGGNVLTKLVPGQDVDYANEYAVPDQIGARGLAYDGEYFWAHDHLNCRIVKFKLGDKGGYKDVGSGKAIEIVATFDAPEKELGGGTGIATDGQYLYIPSTAEPDKLYKLDKEGKIVGEIRFEGPIGPAIAWDGEHFWSGAGNVIFEWSKDGRRIGMIYGPAVETWDLTWGDGYLWTINRTCENWNDAKVFQIKVLDAGLPPDIKEQEPTVPGEDRPPESGEVSGPHDLTVTVDTARVGAPISKYVYGAFIEHQGRCIYGGIWAEMLQDRKFFYPVDYYFPWGEQKHKSPWRAIPFDTVVVMDDMAPYVGHWSPRIKLAGRKARGIVQDGLGLRKGRDYTGYVIAAADGDVTLEVSLVWGPGADGRQRVTLGQPGSKYTRLSFRLTAGADTDDGRLEIVGSGQGTLHIGTASLMPADNVEGMRADTLALLKDLAFTVYRWPGGIFVNDYHWREAIGDRDRRPPRLNNAYWSQDIESNDFGLDEFLTLCRLVGAEPYIVVSATGPEDDRMAAAEVEYVNGAPDTPMGKLRAANGHPEPYKAVFWGVGNEMWAVPLDQYIEQHNRIARAMLAVDPTIKIIAVGGVEFPGIGERERSWARDMLAHCADNMTLISEHIYGGYSPNLIEHANSIAFGVREVTQSHRRYRQELDALHGKDIRLALDEWNYSWENRAEIYGEAGPRYYFRDALGIAVGLHEVFRNSDLIEMVNTHPVNVHGQVKTTKTDAAMEATALVFKLYRHHFGILPVQVSGNYAPLDIAAAWSQDRHTLSIAVVNPTPYQHTINLTLKNARPTGQVQAWVISSPDPMAYNEPGKAPQVTISAQTLTNSDKLIAPPLSIAVYQVRPSLLLSVGASDECVTTANNVLRFAAGRPRATPSLIPDRKRLLRRAGNEKHRAVVRD